MNITLRPIKKEDFPFLKKWQSAPHVREVWGNAEYEEPYEQYVFRTNDGPVERFIIEADTLPIGYFQFYWASRVGGGWWEGFDEATAGIDFYIGEASWLGKGAGLKVLSEAKKMLFADPRIQRIIADPSPKNARIIHLLKKVGFQPNAEIDTPDGRALLMELRR
jgi:RimJ/RimL family protein N-acetyltransferase